MSEQPPFDPLEERLRAAADSFTYPPTPDVAGAARRRLAEERAGRGSITARPSAPRPLALAVALLAIITLGLLAVPDVRAAITSFLRIGSIEIVLPTATPLITTPAPPPTALPTIAATASPAPTATATARSSVLNLAGETTLEQARKRVIFPIRLPTYPPDLGPPDRVFVQDLVGPAVVLVWLDPHDPNRARLSLHILSSDILGQKFGVTPTTLETATVNGQPALWVRGPHVLQYRDTSGNPDYKARRLVEGDVLIWTADGMTYRLETDRPLAEAVRIAESLR